MSEGFLHLAFSPVDNPFEGFVQQLVGGVAEHEHAQWRHKGVAIRATTCSSAEAIFCTRSQRSQRAFWLALAVLTAWLRASFSSLLNFI